MDTDTMTVLIFLPAGILVLAGFFAAFHNHLSWRHDFIWVFRFALGGAVAFLTLVASNDLILRFVTHINNLRPEIYLYFIAPIGFVLGAATGTMYALHRKTAFRETWRLGLACGLPLMLIFMGLFTFTIVDVLRQQYQFFEPPTAEERAAEIAIVAILVGTPAIWLGLLILWALNSGRAVSHSTGAAASQPDTFT